jgi:hypothetical protein
VEPTNIRFGGGASGTVLNPLVALALLIALAILFMRPRDRAIEPLLWIALLVPFGQVVVIGGVHFTVYRILALCGLVRLFTYPLKQNETKLAGGFDEVDLLFLCWAVSYCAINTLQWQETAVLIKNLGSLVDALGGYFTLRFVLQDREDAFGAVRALVPIAVILAIGMIIEQVTRRNIFGMLGGMPVDVAVREGKARSTGSFEVYITAGVFGATLLPLFVWLWSTGQAKMRASVGMAAGLVIAITSNASTSILACMGAAAAFMCWPIRTAMRKVRWALLIVLIGLHLVMKAPVWALIARVDLTGSSSGYHRFMLVDNCIRHFSDWWLLGVKDYDTWAWDMWDLSNQYVAYALTGGLLTLVFFLMLIVRSFRRIGNARRLCASRSSSGEWFVWCLGAAMLAHVVAYFGIGYFDQMQFAWYLLLALIAVGARQPKAMRAKAMAPAQRRAIEVPAWKNQEARL